MDKQDNCNPNEGIDWEDVDMFSVLGAADSGVPGAIAQKQKWEKELGLPIIDTVSAKALSVPEIQADWIED